MDSHQTMRIANLQTMPRGKRSAIALRASNGGHSACSRDGKAAALRGRGEVFKGNSAGDQSPCAAFFLKFGKSKSKSWHETCGPEGERRELAASLTLEPD